MVGSAASHTGLEPHNMADSASHTGFEPHTMAGPAASRAGPERHDPALRIVSAVTGIKEMGNLSPGMNDKVDN